MDSYYKSTSLCTELRDSGVSVAGTLCLNRKHAPQLVKFEKLAKGESVVAECNGMMIMEWRDKREVSFIPLQMQTVRGTEVSKPKCIRQYNVAVGSMDLKDQMVQPYLLERK
jgi:hypothetical protein